MSTQELPIDAALNRASDTIELRQQCPRAVLDVFDAESIARGIPRTELINKVLGEHARLVVHLSTVVQRVTRGNPPLSESTGGAAE